MNKVKTAMKEKKWQNWKAAVGTMVAQSKNGSDRKMNLDDLLLNINDVRLDSLVSQADIRTEEDKKLYSANGYEVMLTVDEFKEKFNVDPSCVWYTPSFSNSCLYLNKETLAAAQFPIEFILSGLYPNLDNFDSALFQREMEVKDNDFYGSLLSLPDGLRMDYFKLLVEKKGAELPGLYELFFSFYTDSDYGFGNIDKETLKSIINAKTDEDKEKTAERLNGLPDKLKIYRGGNSASTPYSEAYSWTLDPNIANFFACRRGSGNGYIVEAEVSKEDVIEAFLDDRNEQELIVNPGSVKILEETKIKGVDFVQTVLPVITPMYHQYRDQLQELMFAQDSSDHGPAHEARVMLLCLTIGHMLDLPLRDRRVLATAAIYHDTQRVNDGDDSVHGRDSRKYYHETTENQDPLVEFLCEYHCLPDEEGYKEIMNNRKLSKSRSRSKLLIDIFKDADALDRVRFGLKALDINQLRLPASRELSLVARMYLEEIKINFKTKVKKPALSSLISSADSTVISAERNSDLRTIVSEKIL